MIQNSSSTEFSSSIQAPGHARHLVAESLAVAGVAPRFPDAELVVCELVTNAVRHTSYGQVRLDIDLHQDGRLRLAVIDTDPTRLPARSPSPGQDGGHGLQIVSAVASDWGVVVVDTAKAVWVELHSDFTNSDPG